MNTFSTLGFPTATETGYPLRNTILCAEYDINTGGSAKLDKLLQKVTIQSYYYVYMKSNIGWSFPGNSGRHENSANLIYIAQQ